MRLSQLGFEYPSVNRGENCQFKHYGLDAKGNKKQVLAWGHAIHLSCISAQSLTIRSSVDIDGCSERRSVCEPQDLSPSPQGVVFYTEKFAADRVDMWKRTWRRWRQRKVYRVRKFNVLWRVSGTAAPERGLPRLRQGALHVRTEVQVPSSRFRPCHPDLARGLCSNTTFCICSIRLEGVHDRIETDLPFTFHRFDNESRCSSLHSTATILTDR